MADKNPFWRRKTGCRCIGEYSILFLCVLLCGIRETAIRETAEELKVDKLSRYSTINRYRIKMPERADRSRIWQRYTITEK